VGQVVNLRRIANPPAADCQSARRDPVAGRVWFQFPGTRPRGTLVPPRL